ncbi:NAD(P)/FAD-dependent oxidoreductase [uncultured Mycobacterium sp.]|uniref:NAD(P)/FAD-dependent oxidoreductase n=1 Tax=uncultured Mycobacterium sp. TaxID=171292 RepID=UPI0035CC8573
MELFDVAIVGARCAGSPLATMLVRRGLRVCLLDQVRFPHETPSTHVMQPCGVQILRELGVLDEVLAAGGVPLNRFTLINDDVHIDGKTDPPQFPAPGLCMRRLTLDVLLVEAAARAGADVRTGCRVTGLMHDDSGRVIGVRTDQGDVNARLVVGADGRHSIVAASAGAAEYLVTAPGRLPAWAYFEGVDDREGRLRIGRQGEHAFLASPTDGGLYMAGIAADMARQNAFHADRDRKFTDGLTRWPELADLLAGAKRVGPIRVMTNWHGYFRQSAGPGWVLVGDAGHFKDFTAAQGMSDALRQAARLAEAIITGFDCAAGPDGQLRQWWRWRDRDANEMYWLAKDMGAPGVSSPLVTCLLRDIAHDPAATEALARVLNHELPPSKLFTVRRLAVAAGHALRARPGRSRATLREITGAIKDEIYRAKSRHTMPHGMTAPPWRSILGSRRQRTLAQASA